MSTFQTIVMGVFVTLVIVGVGVFSLFGGLGNKDSMGPVLVWGRERRVGVAIHTLRAAQVGSTAR